MSKNKRKRIIRQSGFLFFWGVFFLLSGINFPLFSSQSEEGSFLTPLSQEEIPFFEDRGIESLKLAFERELRFLLEKISRDQTLPFGQGRVSPSLLMDSAQLFLQTFRESSSPEELNRLIRERFDVFQAGEQGRVLFTGYFAPICEGSLQPDQNYCWPVYRRPADLFVLNLTDFLPGGEGEELIFRIDEGRAVPYWTRKEIVKEGALAGQGLELVWLRDQIDRFFLMVEGAGKIRLPDGSTFWLNYDYTNGRPYTSVGYFLIKDGWMKPEEASMEGIRKYFREHPQKMDKYLLANDRFVFFKRENDGPYSWIQAILTPARSIATDKAIFPSGALAYIVYQLPQFDLSGKVVGVKQQAHFVFDQDKGGAIKGPARVDLYLGEGKEAERIGGGLHCWGRLYYLLKK